MTAIRAENLQKVFRVRESQKGFSGNLKGLFSPEYRSYMAVAGISFELKKGERVAFVGPNGAGKSTTIKMLTGILHPTSGVAEVAGYTPGKDRKALSYKIGAVFGQRSQLWYHLPASDSFDLLAKVYSLDSQIYLARRNFLVERFGIGSFLNRPVRQLSLGERMRCEIAASLLHKPEILFLDEPTIGLDVTARAVVRDLIRESSETEGTTVLLTSHDTGDMEQVCDRVIVIDHGTLLLDQAIQQLKSAYITKRVITFVTKEESIDLHLPGIKKIKSEPHRHVFEIDISHVSIESVVKEALNKCRLRDLIVEDPPMEEIVREIYKRGRENE